MASTDSRFHGFLTVQSRGVVALPSELRRRYHLDDPGVQLELTEREDGVFEVRPTIPVPAAQSWFWTEAWQEREREADADIAAGRVATFDDAETLLADLEA